VHPDFPTLAERVPAAPEDLESFVADLVASMTADELIATMAGDGAFIRGTRDMSKRYNGEPVVAGSIRRLGLPGIRFTDGPRGVVMYHSTAFPSSMARAATFDVSVEERVGDAIGVEARTQGANLFAGVCINLLRHPAWGRAQETYGEDMHLLGEFGAALVRSTQRHVMACVKHFAVNSMENSRLWLDVRVDEADLRDLYLPHFRRCIDEGAASVMTAYNIVNGTPCGHHHHLIEEVLRDEWGFDGFVMSDFTWGIRSAAGAVDGGMDLEMPFRWRFKRLGGLLRRGRLSRERLAASATRLVRAQARFARIGEPERYRPEVVAGVEHRALARDVAARSIVLLRNEPVLPAGDQSAPSDADPAPMLPIDPGRVRSLAVMGDLAAIENLGDLGSSQVHPPSVVTLLQGLTAAGDRHGIEVRYHDGSDTDRTAALAASCDAVVVVAGSSFRDEGEWIIRAGGDRPNLRLADHHVAMIDAAATANPRVAVVLMGGSAFITDPWLDRIAALAMAWYPGMEGGHAVADVLFGDAAPGGRLPCTWPTSTTTLPPVRRFAKRITYGPLFGYRMMEATAQRPAFPFGFGLGYAELEWSEVTLRSVGDPTDVDGMSTRRVTVEVEVTNRSGVDGVEVAQAYLPLALGTHRAPLLTLRGFGRTTVPAGGTARIAFDVEAPSGVDRIHIGPSADAAGHTVLPIPS
jgi:beta-glucosidase